MALGTPVAGAAAYSASGGTTVAPAYPSGILDTDAVLLFVGQKPSTANGGTVTTPSGWTLREELTGAGGYGTTLGADTGNTNLRIYSWDVPVTGQTGTRSVTLGTNNISWAFIVRVPTGGGALSYGSADGQRTTTPTSPMSIALTNGATATDFEAGDVAIWAMCIPTDVTTPSQFSAQDITATGAVFGTPVELNEPDSQTGNDIGGYSAWDNVDSGSSTTAPTVVTTLAGTLTNVRGPVGLVRIREAPVTHATTGDLTGPGAEIVGSADRQSGSVTHATTGALTGPDATIVGAAARTRAHPSSGDLTGPGAAIVGSAQKTPNHQTTGDLTGPGSTVAGSAARADAQSVRVYWLEAEAGAAAHATTGALSGPGSTLAGTSARTREHPSSGTLAGPGSTVVGSAARTRAHASSGTLAGQSAAIAGSAARTRVHDAAGVLAGPGSAVVGSAARSGSAAVHDTSGDLIGPGALLEGGAQHTPSVVLLGGGPGGPDRKKKDADKYREKGSAWERLLSPPLQDRVAQLEPEVAEVIEAVAEQVLAQPLAQPLAAQAEMQQALQQAGLAWRDAYVEIYTQLLAERRQQQEDEAIALVVAALV